MPTNTGGGMTPLLTGLSSADKTSIASAALVGLPAAGRRAEVLEGDVVCSEPGLSRVDREGEVSCLDACYEANDLRIETVHVPVERCAQLLVERVADRTAASPPVAGGRSLNSPLQTDAGQRCSGGSLCLCKS